MAANDDLPWNTTRCNRLLRPLSSKLAKLRKELDRPRSSGGERRASANASSLRASPRKAANFVQPARKPRGFDKRKDPDWMPDATDGMSRKTYGGRGGKKMTAIQRSGTRSSSTVRPGEIAFTPLIARTTGRFQDSPQLHSSPLKKHLKNRGPLIARMEQIQELKKQMPSEIGNLVKGLSEAYANLLQATTLGEVKRWKGTRSLFGACLRKMPDYIELEDYFAELDKQGEEDEERDTSKEVYNYLEAQFEITPGQGWRSLKPIVRAHGTSLLCDAFADQILGLETLHLLVSHCLNASAWDEAEKFLWSFLPGLKPLSMPNTLLANLFDEQRSRYMWMVKNFVVRTGRHRFMYDQLEYMISQELLPLEWLATECMRPVWDRLVRSLADGDPRSQDHAFRFLETAVFAGIGLPDESLFEEGEIDTVSRQFKPSTRQEFRKALDTTFSSLFTVFCSIALVNRNREEPTGEHIVRRVTWVLDSIVISLLKRNDVRSDLHLLGPIAENMHTFAERAMSAVFASFLVHLEGCCLGTATISLDVPTATRAISWVATQYASEHTDMSYILATLPEFTSAAARGTGRIWKDDGFDQIQRIVQAMLSLSGSRMPHKLWTFKRLALESALEFAQSTNDAQHIAYARGIEKTMRTKGHVVITHSPHKNVSPSTSGGFRWEEGIGEWVACTPFAKQEVRHLPRKPVRVLELLPTPEPSQTNTSYLEVLSLIASNDTPVWGGISVHGDDEDDAFPQSSPVKTSPRICVSSLGKRSRASSPKVLIPAKRSCITPPDSPVTFYPELPAEITEDGRRRSRRTKKEIRALISGLRVRRSRSSLDMSLRSMERKTYVEVNDISMDVESAADSDESESRLEASSSPSSLSSSSSASGNTMSQKLHTMRTRPCLGKMPQTNGIKVDDDDDDDADDNDDRDELSKTPGMGRRTGRRTKIPGRKEWWKFTEDVVDGESEDELSFQ